MAQLRQDLATAFPAQRKGPYRDYITKETWDIRGQRRTLRKRLYQRRNEVQRTDLCAAFQAWKQRCTLSEFLTIGNSWYLQAMLQDVHDRQRLRSLAMELKTRLRHDKNQFCKQVAEQAAHLPPSLVLQKMRCLGVMGKRKRREMKPLQNVTASDGTLLTDEEAINARWRQHFEELEDGVACTKEQLLQHCISVQRSRERVLPTWSEIPTMLDIEEAFRLNKTGRASFYDGVPTDLCHLFPQVMAKIYYGLALKQTLQVAEAVSLKGGVLIHAYKGRGQASQCASYRSLMVSSVLSKSLHRVVRSKCMKYFQNESMPLQLGGLPGKSVSQGAHALISFATACRRRNVSMGILFIDIRQAFYRLVRQHIVHDEDLDQAAARLFATLDLPQESFSEFAAELEGEPAMAMTGIPKFLEQQVAESLNSTWFRLKQSGEVSLTRKGSRPGDNLADLLFTFAFKRIMRRILDVIEAEGISMSFTGCGEMHPFPQQLDAQYCTKFSTLGPVWADDLAIMAEAYEAAELVPKLQFIAKTVIDMLAIYGMQVNCDRGKSELVIDIRGKGAHGVKREIFRHKQPCIESETRHMGRLFINIVPKYKHLGTLFAAKGSMIPEIRQRVGQARAEFQKFRRQIYANKALTIKTRVELFKSLILSGLSFNIAVWPALKKQEHESFRGGLHGLYASLAYAMWGDEVYQWRDEQVIATLQVPDATTIMIIARLRYLQHLVVKGDEYVWAFLHYDGTWLGLIAHDLLWLQRQCFRAVPTVDPRDDWPAWEALVRAKGLWRSILKRATMHCQLQNRKRIEWYGWHRQVLMLLRDRGLWSDQQTVVHDTMHGCLRCRMRFASKAAWAVHCFKLHGRVTRVRSVASGETCVVCQKIYATHDRLINHLRYSQRCFREMRRRHLYTTPQPGRNSVEELQRRHSVQRPTMLTEGPMLPEDNGQVGRHFDTSEVELQGEFVALFHDYEANFRENGVMWTTEELTHKTWQVFQQGTSYPAEMKLMLSFAISRYQQTLDQGDAVDGRLHEGLEALFAEVNRLWCRDWIMGHLPRERETQKLGKGALDPDNEFRRLQEQHFSTVVPRRLQSRAHIFLHLFSGHRREGDLQECVEMYNYALGGVKALSVDLVVSPTWGDLADPAKQRLFMSAILDGWISGVASGPPCETWSKAREVQMGGADADWCPRPIRSALEPWGEEKLTVRELHQLLMGNSLLGIAILMFVAAWLSGTFAMLEHPVEPGSTTSASIWKLEVVKFLVGLPQVQKLVVYQGFFGAASPKPTTLLLAHATSEASETFRLHQCRRLCPKTSSIGRDQRGKFKTSALKAYPRALCMAIAAEWYAAVRRRDTAVTEGTIPEDFHEAVEALHSAQIGESSMGPDFHGANVQTHRHGRRPA